MIAVTAHAEGWIVPVRAQPGARKNGVRGEQAGCLKVLVTASPDHGRANEALVQVLAEVLGVKRSQVELLSGTTSRQKRFLVRGLPQAELQARLNRLVSESGT